MHPGSSNLIASGFALVASAVGWTAASLEARAHSLLAAMHAPPMVADQAQLAGILLGITGLITAISGIVVPAIREHYRLKREELEANSLRRDIGRIQKELDDTNDDYEKLTERLARRGPEQHKDTGEGGE